MANIWPWGRFAEYKTTVSDLQFRNRSLTYDNGVVFGRMENYRAQLLQVKRQSDLQEDHDLLMATIAGLVMALNYKKGDPSDPTPPEIPALRSRTGEI